mgnify:FL=1
MIVNLYIKRKERKLLQKDVAQKIGIHPQSYHLKESGKREFTLSEAIKLAEIFECSLDELFRKDVS